MKIPTPVLRLGSIFFAALASTAATLRPAFRQVLVRACRLVLLHTVAQSSFAAASCPQNPNKVFATLIDFFMGADCPVRNELKKQSR